MRSLLRRATIIGAAVFAVALVPTSGAAQQTSPSIVYARSTAAYDDPSAYEIFSMTADGTDVKQLTDNAYEDDFPAISPDGSQIAFARKLSGQFDLFVMNSDGSARMRLTRTRNADEVLPAWAPDGKRLAFTATTKTDRGWQSDIYRIRIRDGRFRRLTYTPRTKEFAPDWAPDGTVIAFTKQNAKRERYGIAVVRPDVTGLRWLVINPKSGSGYTDVNPSWSPDSQWVAFSRDHGADPYVDIYKVKRNGTGVMPVTQMNELAENPVWGSDGRILFMHNEGLAVVSAEGGEVQHLTETRTGLPYWWPDW